MNSWVNTLEKDVNHIIELLTALSELFMVVMEKKLSPEFSYKFLGVDYWTNNEIDTMQMGKNVLK